MRNTEAEESTCTRSTECKFTAMGCKASQRCSNGDLGPCCPFLAALLTIQRQPVPALDLSGLPLHEELLGAARGSAHRTGPQSLRAARPRAGAGGGFPPKGPPAEPPRRHKMALSSRQKALLQRYRCFWRPSETVC